MSEAESSQAKRPAEDTAEPEAKRIKVECTVQEGTDMLRTAISSADLGVPWSASLRTLLLALTPTALETEKDLRSANDETLLHMLSEILAGEEKRVKESVEEARENVSGAGQDKTKAEEAVEETSNSLKDLKQEAEDAWRKLPDDVVEVRSAEAKLLQSMREMVAKQKETALEVKRDCWEPIKAGSWTDNAEKQKHLATLQPMFKQISTNGACADVLGKKPDERGSFGSKVIEMLEQDLEKHIASLEEQCRSLSSDVRALEGDAAEAEEISFEAAEKMLAQYKLSSVERERTRAMKARREDIEALKNGCEDKTSKRHHTAVKRVCNKIPECKSMVAKLLIVLGKKPADRSDSDTEVITEAELAIDKRIDTLQDQLKESGYDESVGKRTATNLSHVKQFLDLETKEREGKQKEINKEKAALEELRISCFDPLKTGSWVGADVPKAMVRSLNKLFKVLGIEAEMVKTLTGVLKTKPEARAGFDQVLVQQLDGDLKKRIADIDDKLAGADTGKYTELKQALVAAEAAQEAMEDAREKQHSNLTDAISSETKHRNAEERLEKRQETVKERVEAEKQAVTGQAEAEKALEECRRARGALAFLRGCEDEDIEDSAAQQNQPELTSQDAD